MTILNVDIPALSFSSYGFMIGVPGSLYVSRYLPYDAYHMGRELKLNLRFYDAYKSDSFFVLSLQLNQQFALMSLL